MTDATRFIDITLPLSERLAVWPGDAPIVIQRSNGPVRVSELRLSSHAGTHLDAPAHFFPRGGGVDEIALETLIGPAWVAQLDGVSVITGDVLEQAAIPSDVRRLLLKSANSATGQDGTRFDEQYVALDEKAGNWLCARQVALVGVDGPSVDRYTSNNFPVHRQLLAHAVVIVENLRLASVSPGWYRLLCLPMPIQDGDGAPVRAVLETL